MKGKDGKIVQGLLKTFGPQKLQQIINLFFEFKDDWIEEQGRTWGTLQVKANKLEQLLSTRRKGLDVAR